MVRTKASVMKVGRKAYPSWNSLNPTERSAYKRTLEGLRYMRRGATLSSASRQVGTDPKTMKKYLKGVLYKRHRRWRAKREDTLERGVNIYSGGRICTVIIASSTTATLLSRHMNDIKFVLSGRMPYDLFAQQYKNIVITDRNGRKYKLEVRLEKLKEIELRKETSPINDDYYAY